MSTGRWLHICCTVTILVVSLTCWWSSAFCGPIADNFRPVVDRICSVLTDPAYATPEKKQERDKLLHAIASERFDWEEMARRAIGAPWREWTSAQQKEFIDVFVDFLERIYLSKIDLFLKKTKDFSSRNISYTNEIVEGRYAMLESKITIHDQTFPLQYKMLLKNGNWMVYDVTIEGVGLVANYRSQFRDILAKESFESLIARLKSQQPDLTSAGEVPQHLSDNATAKPLQ
ncbi:MAG: ABC transporter substrate-binding protein [Desulfobacterota bacterium]|nr:ABC transporter substrate-binding protein [Thermodesulfobacteriota bacterium]